MLTQEELEKLVKLIDSGKNTYADLHKEFPYMTDEDWIDIIGDDFQIEEYNENILDRIKKLPQIHHRAIIIFFTETPNDYSEHYQFRPDDSFELSVISENLLYQLKKEDKNQLLILISSVCSIIAAITGIISLVK